MSSAGVVELHVFGPLGLLPAEHVVQVLLRGTCLLRLWKPWSQQVNREGLAESRWQGRRQQWLDATRRVMDVCRMVGWLGQDVAA